MKLQKEIVSLVAGAAFFGSVANAEIPLTDDLSAYGYIDMSYTDANQDTELNGSVAEFELGFSFTPVESPYSAVAEISYDYSDTGTASFETVTVTYAASDELSFTVGNILSYQGFETFDATGLYQFSAQGDGGFQGGYVYSAAYAFGGSVDYVTDEFAAGFWAGETDGDLSYEVLLAFTGVEGLTAKLIYADDPGYETINPWVSYEIDALTFAVEYVNSDYDDGSELESYMALVYYSFGDAGITLRYSDVDYDGVDFDKFTISPSYAFSDNLFGLLEVSLVELGGDSNTELAAELIFSF